jgi:cytochrome P450
VSSHLQSLVLCPICFLVAKKENHVDIRCSGRRKPDPGHTKGKNTGEKVATHRSIFHEFLESDLPSHEKSFTRLLDEAQALVAAGSVTSAHYFFIVLYLILANRAVHTRLRRELAEAIPDPAAPSSLRDLEQLPYLSAVVLEGFRVTYGMSTRVTRVSPDAPLVFRDWVVPAGTPVSMTGVFIHDNPRLFPEPAAFRPERWLLPPAERASLEKYLCNFSKGMRACLGMNLGRAEVTMTLAAVVRAFELELFQTDRSDVEMAHDYITPMPPSDSKGVRVLVK